MATALAKRKRKEAIKHKREAFANLRESKDASGHEHDSSGKFAATAHANSMTARAKSSTEKAFKTKLSADKKTASEHHTAAHESHINASKNYDPYGEEQEQAKYQHHEAHANYHKEMASLHMMPRKKKRNVQESMETGVSNGRIFNLVEALDLSTVTKGTVDRIRAFIPHVKVLGKFSPNKHGISGVKGTIYEPSAIEQARELLESGIGNKVCMGHPPRENPDAERKPGEPNGMLVNPRIESGELFADWQLIPSHPMSSQLLDCAENPLLSSQYSMSVNARGYGVPKNDHWCVTHFEPPYIRGTDCVTKGGACTNLRESAETTMKKPFKQVIAVASQSVKDWWANAGKRAKSLNLMEDYEAMGDMPVEAPTEDAAVADMGWKNHLGNLLKSIVEDPEMDPKMMREKITAALKCLEEGEQGEGDEEAADLEEGDEEGDEEMPKKDAMESLRVEVKALRDKEHVRDLCESWNPSPTQFKALVAMQDDTDRKALIAELKAVKKPASGGTFSSSSRTILESREQQKNGVDDYKDNSPEARKKRLARLKS